MYNGLFASIIASLRHGVAAGGHARLPADARRGTRRPRPPQRRRGQHRRAHAGRPRRHPCLRQGSAPLGRGWHAPVGCPPMSRAGEHGTVWAAPRSRPHARPRDGADCLMDDRGVQSLTDARRGVSCGMSRSPIVLANRRRAGEPCRTRLWRGTTRHLRLVRRARRTEECEADERARRRPAGTADHRRDRGGAVLARGARSPR